MPDYDETETDSALANPLANFEREYILSNGGDVGFPGFSIYREGNVITQSFETPYKREMKISNNFLLFCISRPFIWLYLSVAIRDGGNHLILGVQFICKSIFWENF